MDGNYRALTGVVIDAGHGGTDSGATGNGLLEKDLNLKISQYMYNRFRELGIPVTMTRSGDETLSPAQRTERILNAYGNNPNVVVISNHNNATGSGDASGSEVIYALRNNDNLARGILQNLGVEGATMRKYYQRRSTSDTSKDYYFIHRDTGNTEAVIVEYGFIDNPVDAKFVNDNYERLAEAVVRAVANYKGVPYTAPSGMQSNAYVVKAGDSLYSIARQFGTTVDELKQLNNLTNDLLSVGQVLRLPGSESGIQGEVENIYTVQVGDSLYTIAQKFNTNVDNIKNLNNLTSNIIYVGQGLLVPTLTVSGNDTYVVQSGDSLYSIARKFDTTVAELMSLNNLMSSNLSIGQVLKIPTEDVPVGDDGGMNKYTVKSGDSLYKIAREFNTTVNAIKNLNNLVSNNLSVGQVLMIPSGGENVTTTYVVQSGDSLYSIAKKFNTTVDRLKALNSLTSNLLSIGQILIVG